MDNLKVILVAWVIGGHALLGGVLIGLTEAMAGLIFTPSAKSMFAFAILAEASLSFLGAGVQPPDPSWGSMMSDGLELLITSPHLTIVPSNRPASAPSADPRAPRR